MAISLISDMLPRRPALLRRFAGIREILLVAVLYEAYSVGRSLAHGRASTALEHTHLLVTMERRLGVSIEGSVNALVADHRWLTVGTAYTYASLHFIVTPAVLVWLWRHHRASYAPLRTALLSTTVVSLVLFLCYPVAPPRLSGLGITDVLISAHTWGSWGATALSSDTNPYAALPSLHIAWSMWCAIAIRTVVTKRWLRIGVLAYPALMVFVVLGTGNHWVFDIVAGAVVALIPLAVAAAHLTPVTQVQEGRQMTRAIVLGSGGNRGGAWEVGALLALREQGVDVKAADLVIGTSAGSVIAAMLTLGVDLDVIARHQRGARLPGDPEVPLDYEAVAAAATMKVSHPFTPGEPRLITTALLHRAPQRLLPLLGGLAPRGGGDAHLIAAAVRAAMPTPTSWPANLRLIVLDARTGRRRAIGPEDGIPLDLAVAASCAVPGVFAPVKVRGNLWYDGGYASADSADLAAELPDGSVPDEVIVLSPVTVMAPGWPSGLYSWLEQRARNTLRRLLDHELAELRNLGSRVRLLQPDLPCLELMGHDLMLAGRLGPVIDLAHDRVAQSPVAGSTLDIVALAA